MAAYYDEELPLGVVPVLALCDAWLADIDAHLTTIKGVDEFGEGASVVDVHLQWESDLFLWQVTQVCAVELLGEGVLRDIRDYEGLWLVGKAVDEVYDFAKSDFVGYGAVAVMAFEIPGRAGDDGRDYVNAIIVAAVFVALEGCDHFIDEVVDIEEFHLDTAVVDLDREVVGYVVAEGRNRTVVVRTAPFAEEIRETVHEDLRSGFIGVFEHEFLPRLLAAAVLAVAETTCKSCLNRAGYHHRAGVAVLLQGVQKKGGKAEVALHELFLSLRAVDASQVEDKVAV